MKKVVLLITILFVSVISTACINNLAVQELNNKAKEYMANGETEKAICRLRSSIDLDTSIFETHYNLGVALIENKDYSEAQSALENAIKLKPDFADSYYSLALAFENQADELIDNTKKVEESAEDAQTAADKAAKKELSEAEKTKVVEYYNSAIDSYNKYLVKDPESKDKEKVTAQIDYLNNQIKKYNSDRNTSLSDVAPSSSTKDIRDEE